MFRNLLRPDSGLMITMTQVTDCIFLSLFWFLGCLPVVTMGASCAALYDAVYHGFRRQERHPWTRFWRSFRQNWKAGIVPSVLISVLVFLLLRGEILVWNAAATGHASWMLFSGAAFVGAVALGILGLTFPVLSRFENTLAGLLKNTVLLALANLPRTILLGICYAAATLLCLWFVFPLFFLPALVTLISTLFVEPMFRPFLPKEENAEVL